MHAFNNAVAYAVQADDGWKVSVVVGPLVLVGARARRAAPLPRRRRWRDQRPRVGTVPVDEAPRPPHRRCSPLPRSPRLPRGRTPTTHADHDAARRRSPSRRPGKVVAQGRRAASPPGSSATWRPASRDPRRRDHARPTSPARRSCSRCSRSGKVVSRQAKALTAGRKGTGKAAFRVKTRRSGVLKLRVVHQATAKQQAFASRTVRGQGVTPPRRQGSRGTKVVLLQRGLRRLGFAVPTDGGFDAGTARAVLAFRKTNGLGRNGFASTASSRCAPGPRRLPPRFPKAGRHVEFDWSRQVLALLDRRPRRSRLPRVLGQALDAHRVRHASASTARSRARTPRHGAVELLHRRLRDPRLRRRAELPGQPRLHPGADPERLPDRPQISLGETIFVYR